MADLVIKPLGPDTVGDLLAFFDGQAFSDNDWWAGCYCMFFHTPGDDWDATKAAGAAHREVKRAHVLAGRSHGWLAFRQGRAVGWLNAAPRDSYENLRRFTAARDGTERVGALLCFIVAPGERGRGVATALLEAACDGFRRDGLRFAEGYARTSTKRDEWETFELMNYHGPLSMYEKAGFSKVGELPSFAIMRKAL